MASKQNKSQNADPSDGTKKSESVEEEPLSEDSLDMIGERLREMFDSVASAPLPDRINRLLDDLEDEEDPANKDTTRGD